jgi:hypothetical protein
LFVRARQPLSLRSPLQGRFILPPQRAKKKGARGGRLLGHIFINLIGRNKNGKRKRVDNVTFSLAVALVVGSAGFPPRRCVVAFRVVGVFVFGFVFIQTRCAGRRGRFCCLCSFLFFSSTADVC